MTEQQTIQVGDRVRLRSGSPEMLVRTLVADNHVEVSWLGPLDLTGDVAEREPPAHSENMNKR